MRGDQLGKINGFRFADFGQWLIENLSNKFKSFEIVNDFHFSFAINWYLFIKSNFRAWRRR